MVNSLLGGLLQLMIKGTGIQGKEIGGSSGNLGIWKETFGSDGKFQSMTPPPLLPQPGHPTMIGTTVV